MSSLLRSIRRFLSELRRRNVYRVALAYLAAGFVVVELADIATGTFDLPGWFGPMVWVVVGLGFPIALVIAWAFEVTPEGVRVEEAKGTEEGAHGPEGFSVTSTGLITGLLIIAIGLQVYPRVFSSEERAGGQPSPPDTAQINERSIAVLPFAPLSSGEESETFAEGIHDDLLTRLSNISSLKVTSRTSVQKYRDTELSLPAIADSLGVRWVMEGGVQVLQDQIQVNAQLIDPRGDIHVWAEDYRRDLTAEDLFAIQGEITREIAEALKANLTAGEQRRIAGAPTENLRAYRLYVKGRSQLDSRTEEGMRRAVEYFRQALQEDSTFALAWSGLADALVLRKWIEFEVPSGMPSPEEAARRALEMNPDLGEAHASMGLFHMDRRNGPAALRHLRRAVKLKPSYYQAQHWLGLILLLLGQEESAIAPLQRAVELTPQHGVARTWLASAYLANGWVEKGLTEARRQQGSPTNLDVEIRALLRLGRFGEARRAARQSRVLCCEDLPFTLAMINGAAGDTMAARKHLKEMRERGGGMAAVGLVEAAMGRLDAAFRALRQAEPDERFSRGSWTLRLRYHFPDLLRAFRDDFRYEELIRQINQAWGLNPDGSLPEDIDVSTSPTDR